MGVLMKTPKHKLQLQPFLLLVWIEDYICLYDLYDLYIYICLYVPVPHFFVFFLCPTGNPVAQTAPWRACHCCCFPSPQISSLDLPIWSRLLTNNSPKTWTLGNCFEGLEVAQIALLRSHLMSIGLVETSHCQRLNRYFTKSEIWLKIQIIHPRKND